MTMPVGLPEWQNIIKAEKRRSLPVKVGPVKSGSVSFLSGVWGRAPAEVKFGEFFIFKIWQLVAIILMILFYFYLWTT